MALTEDQIAQTQVEVRATLEESMKGKIQEEIDKIAEGYKGDDEDDKSDKKDDKGSDDKKSDDDDSDDKKSDDE